MKNLLLLIASLLLVLLYSCNGDDESGIGSQAFTVTSIDGSSQKGPYLIGSTITIFELESDLIPTGRSFAEEITDNLGSFKIENLELASSLVEIRANGFYFNEVRNENSAAQLSLTALSDLQEKESINVNILSTLEKRRTEYLINAGQTFAAAKAEALSNVLNIFEIDISSTDPAELLDISKDGNGNAALLAISTIIQSYGSVADVSELISAISNDIEKDGTLDDASICTKLINNANLLNLAQIRSNLEAWFVAEGNSTAVVPDFEKFVNGFKINTPCSASSSISYPENGTHGKNILNPTNFNFQKDIYSMRAILEPGTSLKVKIYGNNWAYSIGQVETGWTPGDWNSTEYSREFTNNREGDLDFQIRFVSPLPGGPSSDNVFIEVFENGAATPSWTNTIIIGGIETRVVYEDFGNFGDNILAGNISGPNNPMDGADFSASLSAEIPEGYYIDVILTGHVWRFPDQIQNQGWAYELLDATTNSFKFTSAQSGSVDFEIILFPPCDNMDAELSVEIFENGSATADYSYSERIEAFFINDFPPDGAFGENILHEGIFYFFAGQHSMTVQSPQDIQVVLKGTGWSLPNPIQGDGWTVEAYDNASSSQKFIYDGDTEGDLLINLDPSSSGTNQIEVDIYEGCVNEPTISNVITVEG